MNKLFKKLPSGELAYHEAWVDGKSVIEHWGRVGTRGNSKTHTPCFFRSPENVLKRVLSVPESEGFQEIPIDDHSVLIIEYTINGMGTKEDLDKRHALQDRMDETLGWMGLGLCDGGSIGSGTMEVCCLVVDFEIAKDVIERDLAGTSFADYARIYHEG